MVRPVFKSSDVLVVILVWTDSSDGGGEDFKEE